MSTKLLSLIAVFLITLASISINIKFKPYQKSLPENTSAQSVESILKQYEDNIWFEQNLGQFNNNVRFQANTRGARFRFLEDALSIGVMNEKEDAFVWNMHFVNAKDDCQIKGKKENKTKINYLCASRSVSNISSFSEIWYEDIYDHTDLRFYSKDDGRLEYDFILYPGACLDEVQLELSGIENVRVAHRGALVLQTPIGQYCSGAPYTYQVIDGKELAIASSYVIDDNCHVRFEVNEYDPDYPLIIDPTTLLDATYFGNTMSVSDMEVTANGIYISGYRNNTGIVFPTTPGVIKANDIPGEYSIGYVVRFSHDLTTMDFATYIGSAPTAGSVVRIQEMEVDGSGNIYLAGEAANPATIPTTTNAFQKFNPKVGTGLNYSSVFAMKINSDASSLVYGTYVSADDSDGSVGLGELLNDMKIYNGKMYLVGETKRTTFPTTAGAYQINKKNTGTSQNAGFAAILNTTGTMLEYSTYLSGPASNRFAEINAIDINPTTGTIYLGGNTSDVDFPNFNNPVAFDDFDKPTESYPDGFLVEIDPKGNGDADLLYATEIGTDETENLLDLAALNGEVFVYMTHMPNLPTDHLLPLVGSPYQAQPISNRPNIYVANIRPSDGQMLASSYIPVDFTSGGVGIEMHEILLGSCGDVYLSGEIRSNGIIEMPPDAHEPSGLGTSTRDGFLLRLNEQLSTLTQGTYVGGNNAEKWAEIDIHDGAVYFAGTSSSPDIPVSADAFMTSGGASFGYIMKYSNLHIETENDTICGSKNIQLNQLSVHCGKEPYTYQWTALTPASVNSINDNTLPNPTVDLNATATFQVQVTDAHGAIETDTVHLELIPGAAQVDAGENRHICSGDTTQIGTHHFEGVTYSWSPTAGLSSASVGKPNAFPNSTTTYTLTYTDCSGTTATDDVVVYVDAHPSTVIDAGANAAVCIASDYQIGTPEVATFTYSWSPAEGLDNPNIAQPTALKVFAEREYTLTMTSLCTGATATDVIQLTIDLASANAGEDKKGCPGTNVTIGNSPNPLYTSYSWTRADDGSTTGITNPTSANPSVNIATAGTYKIVLETTSSCGTTRDTMQIIFENNIPVANAGADVDACVNWPDTTTHKSIQIGTPGDVNFSYQWIVKGGASAAPFLNNVNAAQPIASVDSTTEFVLTQTSLCNGAQDKDTVAVNVPANVPSVDAYEKSNPNQTTICPQPFGGDFIGMDGEAGVIYSWSPTAGLYSYLSQYNGLDAPSVAAKPFFTTRYTLTAIDTCSGKMATDTVLVVVETGGNCVMSDPLDANAAPSAEMAEEEVVICKGESVQIGIPASANSNMSYQWSPTADLSAPTSSTTTVNTPSGTRTYILTTTNTNTGISHSDQVMVVVRPQVLASAGSSPLTFDCIEDINNIHLGPATGQTQYENPDWDIKWTPELGLNDPKALRPTLSGPDVADYYEVRVIDPVTGCSSTAFVTLQFNSSFSDAGADKSLCPGNSVQIGTPALPSSGDIFTGLTTYSYEWTPKEGLDNPYTAQPNASPSKTQIYTVTVTKTVQDFFSQTICNQSSSVVVTLENTTTETANAGSDHSNLCPSDPDVTIGTNTDESPDATYSWTNTSYLNNATLAQPTVDVSALPTGTTTFELTVTDVATGCTTTDKVDVEVNPTTPPSVSVDPAQSGCVGSLVDITGASVPAGYDFQWTSVDDPGLQYLGQTNSLTPKVKVQSTSLTYTLEASDKCGGAPVTASVTITPTAGPSITSMGSYGVVCPGGPLALLGVAATGATSFTWSPATAVDNAFIQNPNFIGTETTTLSLTVSDGTCEVTDNVTIQVDMPPVDAGKDEATCTGAPVTVGTPGNPALYNYNWAIFAGPGPLPGVVNTPQITVNPTGTTQYQLTVTTIAGACPASTDIVTVTIPTGAPTANAGADDNKCLADPAVSIGSALVPGMTYAWSPAAGLSANDVANPKALPEVTTTYTVTVTNPCNGLMATDQVVVTIDPAPVADAGEEVSGCFGDSFTLGSTDLGHTYSWWPTTGLSDPSSAMPTVSLSKIGPSAATITYTLTVDDGVNCTAADEVVVTFNPIPELDYNDRVVCQGSSVGVDNGISGVQEPYSIIWTPNQNISNNKIAAPIFSPTQTTEYTVTVFTPAGCMASQTIVIKVDDFSITPTATPACEDGTTNISVDNIPGASYQWSGPNGFSSSQRRNSLSNLVAADFGSYSVTVTSSNGCTKSASVELVDVCTIVSDCDLSIDNVAVGSCTYDTGSQISESEVTVTVSWGSGAPSGEKILVYSLSDSVYIDATTLTSPQSVDLTVPADSTYKNGVAAHFETTTGCNDIEYYDAPPPCMSLPVELSQFEAHRENCDVRLNWTVESETQFSHYELQRSSNGISFHLLEEIASAGSNGRNIYQYLDRESSKINYYRLKMVDLDGSVRYSKMLSVRNDCYDGKRMIIFPNPAVHEQHTVLNVKLFSQDPQATLAITDLTGRNLKTMILPVQQDWNMIRLNISDLPAGTYFIQHQRKDGTREVKKFVLQQ